MARKLLPRPDWQHVEDCFTYSDGSEGGSEPGDRGSGTRIWRGRAEQDYAYDRGNIPHPLTGPSAAQYAAVIPPTATVKNRTGAAQMFPSGEGLRIIVQKPVRRGAEAPSKKDELAADTTEQILQAVLRAGQDHYGHDVAAASAHHCMVCGMGVVRFGYDAELRLERPKTAKKGSEEYELWLAASMRKCPYFFKIQHPLATYPNPDDDGESWCIEKRRRTGGSIFDEYGRLPKSLTGKHGWRAQTVDWIEYRDEKWRWAGVYGESEAFVVGEHYGACNGYALFASGLGEEDGPFETRFIGLTTLIRELGLLDDEARNLTAASVTNQLAAFPSIAAHPALGNIQVRPGAVTIIDVQGSGLNPNEVNLSKLMSIYQIPNASEAQYRHIKTIQEYQDLASISRMVGTGDIETDTYATAKTALQEGKSVIVPARMNEERMWARRVLASVAVDLRQTRFFPRDDPGFRLSVPGEDGQQKVVTFRRDDVQPTPDIQVVIDPQSAAEKAGLLQSAVATEPILSLETRLEKFSVVPNAKAEVNRRRKERLLDSMIDDPKSPLREYAMLAGAGLLPEGVSTWRDWILFKKQQNEQQPSAPTPFDPAALAGAGAPPPGAPALGGGLPMQPMLQPGMPVPTELTAGMPHYQPPIEAQAAGPLAAAISGPSPELGGIAPPIQVPPPGMIL